jgi:hypothetical protein
MGGLSDALLVTFVTGKSCIDAAYTIPGVTRVMQR